MIKRKTTQYSLEFKKSSANLAVSSEEGIKAVAINLGVHPTTLRGWVKKYCPQDPLKKLSETELTEELKQLRKENARLKQERDILKKATAYFANDPS